MSSKKAEPISLTPSYCSQAIEAMMGTDVALFLWGPPGTSKSQLSQAVANKRGIAFIDFRLSQCDPTDLRGVPYPTIVGGVEGVRWSTPYVLPRDLDLSFTADLLAEETTIHIGNPVGSNGIHYCTNPRYEVRTVGSNSLVAEIVSSTLDSVTVALYDVEELAAHKAGGPAPTPRAGTVRLVVTGECEAILGLEEFNSAPPSVQAAAYQLVLDRRLGEYEVPKKVFIMGMGNRDTDKGVTFKMPTPILNRFVHIEIASGIAAFDDWQKWALLARVNSDVVGYLSAFKNHLFDFDAGTAARGFATPRSWEFVSKILTANPDMPEMLTLALVSGAVGEGIAVQFVEHRKVAKELPAAEDILSGRLPKMAKKPEVALQYALATTLCYELKDRELRVRRENGDAWKKSKGFAEWLTQADHFLAFLMENFQPEICIMGAKAAIQLHKLPFDTSKMANFDKFAERYRKLIMS
jgi:hypothetical protein